MILPFYPPFLNGGNSGELPPAELPPAELPPALAGGKEKEYTDLALAKPAWSL
jgi:hypothetical protein